MDLLDRCAARSRGLAAGHRRHDVHPLAVPEQRLRRRSEHPADRMEAHAEAGFRGDRPDVLRYRQSRPRLRRRQGFPAAGRLGARGARRQDRRGGLAGHQRRSEARRGEHQCAARLRRQGHHRHFRWRVGRTRLYLRLQHQGRQDGLAWLLGRSGCGDADGSGQDHDLGRRQDAGGRQGFFAEHVEGRPVEDRWRHDLGLVFV